VTALAVDPAGQFAGRCDGWIAVVAEQALIGDGSAEVEVIGAIVAGAHRPVSATVRVPAYREFDESAVGAPVDVGTGVVTGAGDVMDLAIEDVGGGVLEAGLGTTEEKAAAALFDGVGSPGGFVLENAWLRAVLGGLRAYAGKGPPHAGFHVGVV
jgi:hypothetical protein